MFFLHDKIPALIVLLVMVMQHLPYICFIIDLDTFVLCLLAKTPFPLY